MIHSFLSSDESLAAHDYSTVPQKSRVLLSAWLEQKLKSSLKKPTYTIQETRSTSPPARSLHTESHHYLRWRSLMELRNTIPHVLVQYQITSFCYESLIFCTQRIALFPLDVLLPHVYLLSLLWGILWGDRGSIAVQTFHHCLIFLEQKQCSEQHF